MSRRSLHRAVVAIIATFHAGVAFAASVADGQAAYDAGKFDLARTIWSDLGHAGDAQAAFALATLYDLGNGVKADPAASYCWYRQAGSSLPAAAFNVAVMHDSGRGARQDAEEAARWYGRAAAAGYRRAQFNLGQLYEAGEGVPANPALAASWFRAAAQGGLQAASDRLQSLPASPKPAQPGEQLVPARLDPPAAMAAWSGPVALTWAAPAQPVPVSYYVEVVSLDHDPPTPAFTTRTDLSAAGAELPPGNYAGRIFTVAAERSHYATGGWTRFSVGPDPEGLCSR